MKSKTLKIWLYLLLVIGLTLYGGGYSILTRVWKETVREDRDWAFVQSCGGMLVGIPTREPAGKVRLPVNFNASGRLITIWPTQMSAELVCRPLKVRVEGNQIYLTVRTSAAPLAEFNAACPDADLGKLAAGQYTVSYRSPNGSTQSLGLISVSP